MSKEQTGFFYTRPDARVHCGTVNLIQGAVPAVDIIDRTPPSEQPILESVYGSMQMIFTEGGAITASGHPVPQSLFRKAPRKQPPVFERLGLKRFKQKYGVHEQDIPVIPGSTIYIWTAELARWYKTVVINKRSLDAQYMNESGGMSTLRNLEGAFANYISSQFVDMGIVPSLSTRSVARSFLIEILSRLNEEYWQPHDTQQLPPKQ